MEAITIHDKPDLQTLSDLLRVLAEPNRLRIFDLLMQRTYCNCELGEALDLASNLVSHHLKVLREAGLIDVERATPDARWLYYSVNREKLGALSAALEALLDPRRIQPLQPNCGVVVTTTATMPRTTRRKR